MPVARYNVGDIYGTPGLTYGPAASPAGAKKHMQNLASLNLSAQDLTDIDAALTVLEQKFADFVDLTPEQRSSLPKMGNKSEAFCRETLVVLGQNPGILPASFDLAETQADLANIDTLRPRITRLQQIMERGGDTLLAFGSDVMVASLEGYGYAKLAGVGSGLDALRAEMKERFKRKSKKTTTPPPENP